MNDPAPQNLTRWLAAGLVAGAIVIGVAAAAYFVGYSRGKHHDASPAAAAAPTTTQVATSTAAATTTSVASTPALVAQGRQLYGADGCSACHSLTGAAGAGPSFKGLAGSSVTLTTGQAVTADDAYLERSITDPDAEIVKGYNPGIMTPAISGFGLGGKSGQVQALVAFIDSQT